MRGKVRLAPAIELESNISGVLSPNVISQVSSGRFSTPFYFGVEPDVRHHAKMIGVALKIGITLFCSPTCSRFLPAAMLGCLAPMTRTRADVSRFI
jgi:hypothetical protein